MALPALHRSGGTGNIAVPFSRMPESGELERLTNQGADIFELRLDMAGCTSPLEAQELAQAFAGYPLIATARCRAEGGHGNADDAMRMILLAAAIPHACALDVELSSSQLIAPAAQLAAGHNCDLILSFHHFGLMPPADELISKLHAAAAAGAQVFKAACRTATEADVAVLAEVLSEAASAKCKAAVMGVGESEVARLSRVTLAKAGSCFVFAQAGQASAPGQPELQWLASQLDSS